MGALSLLVGLGWGGAPFKPLRGEGVVYRVGQLLVQRGFKLYFL